MIRCPSCGEENPERFRFCGVCGSSLEAVPAAARREVRKTVTVLFADVSGSTALGNQLDPESMRRLLARRFAAMREILERHGGTVEKFIGDAVMAVFGVPTVHEDDALRAVRAAAEMRAAIERLNADGGGEAPIALRTGVNTGEVVTGDPATGETLVTGDAVNMAARLEQAAAPGEILLGELTWQLVRDAVTAAAAGPLMVKGKDEPIAAYRLEAVHATGEGRTRRHDAAMVDRERELRTLRRAFEDVEADRRCHLVTVLGPAGMGKTRILNELLATTAAGARVLRGRCLPYGEGITLWPLREMLLSGDPASDGDRPPLEVLAAVAVSAIEPGPDRDRIIEALGRGLGLIAEPVAREELFWAVRRVFDGLAADQTLIAAFDDLHWAEPMLLDLIESVADLSREARLMLVCAARPEFLELRPAWGGGKLNATTMLLEPLPDTAMTQLLSDLTEDAAIPPGLRTRIIETADGLPLYVEELVRMLRDEAALSTGAQELAQLPAPPSVRAIVTARLERLDSPERTVLERAAVIGRNFDRATLLDLLPDDLRLSLTGIIDSLVRKELIRPDGSAAAESYRFRHLLVRDSAYASLPKEERAALHRRHAARLRGDDATTPDPYPEIRGYHLVEAHRYLGELGAPAAERAEVGREAALALATGGRRAFGRHDRSAAESLLSRAVWLLPEDDHARLELELVLAEVLRQRGDLQAALQLLESVGDRATATGATAIAARAEIFSLWVRGSLEPRDWTRSVAELAARLEPVLTNAADDEGLSLLWGIRLDAAMSEANVVAATAAATQALERAGRGADAWQLGRRARATLGELAVVGNQPVAAALAACEALLAEDTIDRRLESALLASVARLQAMAGDAAAAGRAAERAVAIADELDLLYARAFGEQASAFAARLAGDVESALAHVRQGLAELDRRGDRRAAAGLALDEAEVLLEANRIDDARDALAHLSGPDAPDDPQTRSFRAGLDAILRAQDGASDEVWALAAEAVSLAAATGSPVWLARAEAHKAMTLDALGLHEDAAAARGRAAAALGAKDAPGFAAHLTRSHG